MKAAIFVHRIDNKGGQERIHRALIEGMLQRGHSVTAIAASIDADFVDHPRFKHIEVPYSRKFGGLVGTFQYAKNSAAYLRDLQQTHDLIYENGFVTDGPCDVIGVQFVNGWRIRHSSQEWGPPNNANAIYQRLFTKAIALREDKAFRCAKKIIAASELVKNQLIEVGVPDEKISVVLNGVNPDEFGPSLTDRKKLGLPENVPLALFVGDIRTARKNLDTVLRALVDCPGVHLAVAGSVARSPYPKMAENLAVADRVRFLDFRTDIPDLMRASDVFTFPSRYEACSIALLEAMASGLPVITAKTAGGAEVVTSECGYVLEDPNDVASLTRHLRALTSDSALRSKMGTAARQVVENYTWERMTDRYVDVFESVHASCSRT
jgi:glycosyltransferase involved in cell wall biosynthesis